MTKYKIKSDKPSGYKVEISDGGNLQYYFFPNKMSATNFVKRMKRESKKNPSIKSMTKWTKVKAVRVVKGMLQILK